MKITPFLMPLGLMTAISTSVNLVNSTMTEEAKNFNYSPIDDYLKLRDNLHQYEGLENWFKLFAPNELKVRITLITYYIALWKWNPPTDGSITQEQVMQNHLSKDLKRLQFGGNGTPELADYDKCAEAIVLRNGTLFKLLQDVTGKEDPYNYPDLVIQNNKLIQITTTRNLSTFEVRVVR